MAGGSALHSAARRLPSLDSLELAIGENPGLTRKELADLLGWKPKTLRNRVAELKQQGRIEEKNHKLFALSV